MHHYVFCPRQKNYITHFQNQRFIGIFMSPYIQERERERERGRGREKERARATEREQEQERVERREKENKSAGNYITKPPRPK